MALTLDGTTGITTSGSSSSGAGGISTNTALGGAALAANTTGSNNTAVGYQALDANTTGTQNTAMGTGALGANVSGTNNTAVGYNALLVNTGNANTAIGHNSGAALTSGGDNTALGLQSLYVNTTGNSNTALGVQALASNTTASFNTAVGRYALNANTTASYNTAVGFEAGYSQTTAEYNTFIGYRAGKSTTGEQNTFIGKFAGNLITTGTLNTIIGAYNGNQGGLDIRTASSYIVLSDGGGTPRLFFDNNGICRIENAAGGSGALRVRNTNNVSGDSGIVSNLGSNTQNTSSYFFIGSTPGVSDKIYIYGNGNIQNSNNSYGGISDVKLKENIVDAAPKLADLMQVRVRNYNLKSDPTHKQIGVVAQELEQVFPGLVDESPDRDPEGGTLGTTTKSVKYSVFVPMLIKAIQELKAINDAQASRIETLEAKVAALEAR